MNAIASSMLIRAEPDILDIHQHCRPPSPVPRAATNAGPCSAAVGTRRAATPCLSKDSGRERRQKRRADYKKLASLALTIWIQLMHMRRLAQPSCVCAERVSLYFDQNVLST